MSIFSILLKIIFNNFQRIQLIFTNGAHSTKSKIHYKLIDRDTGHVDSTCVCTIVIMVNISPLI